MVGNPVMEENIVCFRCANTSYALSGIKLYQEHLLPITLSVTGYAVCFFSNKQSSLGFCVSVFPLTPFICNKVQATLLTVNM